MCRVTNAVLVGEAMTFLEDYQMQQTNSHVEQLLSTGALADKLSLSKRSVHRNNSSGRLPAPVRINGAVRWRQSDIEQWIAWDCPNRKAFEMRMEQEGIRNG